MESIPPPYSPSDSYNNDDTCIRKSCDWVTAKLLFMEFIVVLAVLAAGTLVVFGSFRRRCSNSVFNVIQFVNLSVTTLLVTFSIGQMESAPFQNELFAVWGLILLVVIGCPDCFSAYSPTDNEQWKSYRVQVAVQASLVGILVSWTIAAFSSSNRYGLLAALLLLLCTNRTNEKAAAMKMATKSSLAKTTKYISDFMTRETDIPNNGEQEDPKEMEGYHYLVSGDADKSKWITTTSTTTRYNYQLTTRAEDDEEIVTLHKIWQFSGSLLADQDGKKLKDICLSFALYRLLCRRFGGHPLQSGKIKTWRLIRDGLLSEEKDYERAFRVIEVELSFLFDLFYTKYAVIFQNGHRFINKRKFLDVVLVLSSCVILLVKLKNYLPGEGALYLVTLHGRIVDKLVTYFVVVLIFFMEIAQLPLLLVSDWFTVLLICNYVRKKPLLRGNHSYLIFWKKIVILCQGLFKPWERKLGQYCLLKSFNQNPWELKFKFLLTSCFCGSVNIPRAGQKGNARIKLPEEVKEAVIICLRRNDQPFEPRNGEDSLHRHGVWDNQQISSACKLETSTHVILVWHVATSLCMFDESTRSPTNSVGSRCRNIASALSGYCSYLVAFAPRLICDNPMVCEFIFDEVIKEAREIFQNRNLKSERYRQTIIDSGKDQTIIHKGAELAEALQNLPNGKDKWEVLADFWVELMLFLAPSGDPMAHVEHLAKGGEFVTHLWALLSHAGILNQGSTSSYV